MIKFMESKTINPKGAQEASKRNGDFKFNK